MKERKGGPFYETPGIFGTLCFVCSAVVLLLCCIGLIISWPYM